VTKKRLLAEITDRQEELGVANFLAWEGPVVVLSEGWPSWSFTLDGLNCTKLFTYCDFASSKVKNEFLFSSLGRSHIETWSELITVVRFANCFCARFRIFLQSNAGKDV